MITVTDLKAWIEAAPDVPYTEPEINPGPPTYEGVADTAGPAIVLTIGGGPGLELEDTYDRTMVAVDVAGDQNDYDGAEAFARWLDSLFLAITTPQTVAGSRVLAVRRTGGSPVPISVDDGDRWHFGCSYTWRIAN